MKVKIKLSRRHPHGVMSFGRYMVTNQEQELELNESEIKDLKNDGPKHWFSVVEIKAEENKPAKATRTKKAD